MPQVNGSDVNKLVIACEAGMGSSVLLVNQMKKRLKSHNVTVEHSAVNRLNDDTGDLVLCHQGLSDRARSAAPNTVIIPFNTFMGDPAFDRVEKAIANGETLES